MPTRRFVLQGAASALALGLTGPAWAQPSAKGPDRILICNEDSNTLSVIDPATNTVAATINLTSFDEDPRPPFRYVTGGVSPTHLAMVRKPLYHGAIDILYAQRQGALGHGEGRGSHRDPRRRGSA